MSVFCGVYLAGIECLVKLAFSNWVFILYSQNNHFPLWWRKCSFSKFWFCGLKKLCTNFIFRMTWMTCWTASADAWMCCCANCAIDTALGGFRAQTLFTPLGGQRLLTVPSLSFSSYDGGCWEQNFQMLFGETEWELLILLNVKSHPLIWLKNVKVHRDFS